MKKFALAFSVLLLILSSCSKSDTTTQDPILVKKMIETDSKTGDSYILTFTYNGNKIESTSSTGSTPSKDVYTYSGDLITKIDTYDTKNTIGVTQDYTYLNGKLSTYIYSSPSITFKYKVVYINNNDGTISFAKSTIYTAPNSEVRTSEGKYTFLNNNFIKSEITGNTGETINYEYDNKNNPMKNILGFNLLLSNDNQETSVNNWTKSTSIYGTVTPVYTYNSNNYPTKKIDGTTTTEYFY
jgi:hypothetical protein